MYTGCNGATCTCCITDRECVYVEKYDLVCIGKWKRPFEQVAWGEANLDITNKTNVGVHATNAF
jgi:hypothetical protein